MAGEFFIFTFGPGGEPGETGDLIPLGLIKKHFRPFMTRYKVTDRSNHEALLVYPVVCLNSAGVWEADTSSRGDAVNDAEMAFRTSFNDKSRVEYISFAHHPDHPAFEAGVHALLVSASAVAVKSDGCVLVTGRKATLANLPTDMVATMGKPHLAHTAGELWKGPERTITALPPPTTLPATPDDELNISRGRQALMVDQISSSVFNHLHYHIDAIEALLHQIRIEHPGEAQIADLENYARLIDQAATSSAAPANAGWVARSSAAFGDIIRFGLASRINTGRITNRFTDRLQDLGASLHACLHRGMPEVARQLRRFKKLDKEARRRQLTALSTNEPDIADLQNWPDTVLAAQRKLQVAQLQSKRRDVWQSLKGDVESVSDWIKQLAQEHPAEPFDTDMIALHALLVTARKAAKDESRMDWDDAMRSTTLPIVAFAIHARVLARVTPGPFEVHLWNQGLWLKARLPKQLTEAFLAGVRLEAMDVEMGRRGNSS